MQETQGLGKAPPGRPIAAGRHSPTIGLLTRQVSDELTAPLWSGVADVARQHSASLITFPGGSLHDPQGFQEQGNALYELVGPENVDGLIVWTGLLGHYVSMPEMAEFCARYSPLPVVSVEMALPGIPSVLADVYEGMRTLITHLITVHGYRRIAFIRGSEESVSGDERFRGYVDALTEHGLPVDPELIAPGTFLAPSGEEAVRLLIDERHVQFDALAASNDAMALDALKALQARGIRVPEDVAVTGFDDLSESQSTVPPLTTVRVPLQEMGCQATELLMARMKGRPAPDRVSMPTQFVLRRSCGCPSSLVVQAASTSSPRSGGATLPARIRSIDSLTAAQRDRIVRAMVEALPEPGSPRPGAWSRLPTAQAGGTIEAPRATANRLLSAFVEELGGESPGQFISTLDGALHGALVTEQGSGVGLWQNAISAMRRLILPALDNRAIVQRAEDLWQQARVLVGEVAQRAESSARHQAEQQAARLRELGQELATVRSLDELTDVLMNQLGGLGIGSAYLALYENPTSPTTTCKLIGAYTPAGRVELTHEDTFSLSTVRRDLATSGESVAIQSLFPSGQLLPPPLWPAERSYTLVAEPLYFGAEQLGFILLDIEPHHVVMCDALREQISSALMGALLTQQVQRRAVQLQTAAQISSTASSVLDPDELIRQAVSLVRSQFGLYYVGLFLLDEESRYAVLCAGTGEAGQQMVSQGHKLEVGETSMIGSSIAHQQARVALDVSQEKVHVHNPLLPGTRSELALPLLSRGQAIGALTVQSTQLEAFSPEDISVFQTVADQLANAIANARLFEQTQRALRDAETSQRRYLREAWQEYLEGREAVQGYRHSAGGEGSVVDAAEHVSDAWLPVIGTAVSLGKTAIEQDTQDGATLGVPLMLSGEIVGAVAGAGARSEGFSRDEIAAVEAIAEQLALALENQRLFERAQRATALMSERVRALDCLNDIGHKTEEAPPVDEFLEWVAHRVPQALRHASVCVAAIEFEGQIYGTAEAFSLPRQMVHRMIVAGQRRGRMVVAYREDHEFLDEESALLGDVVRRTSGYVENRRLIEQTEQAARRLAEERALLRTLIDSLPDPTYVKDRDSRLTLSNVAHVQFLGAASEDEVVGQTDFDRFPRELADGFYAAEQEVIRTGLALINREEYVVDGMGAPHWLWTTKVPLRDDSGRITGLVGINRDITDRKRAEEVLRESESRLRSILESIQTGVLILDPETHTIVDVNPIGAKLIGAPREVIVGSLCHKFVCPAEVGRCPITDLGLTVDNAERILLTAAGEKRSIIKTVSRIVLGGRPHLLESFTDITQRIEAEAKVERSRNQLQCLSDIGQKVGESLPAPEFLQWVVQRIPQGFRYPELCLTAVEFQGATYGTGEALQQQRQMVQSLRRGKEIVGRLCVAYREERDFTDEESALLGDIARRLDSYVENRRLLEQTQAALAEVEATHRRYLQGRWETFLRQREDLLHAGFVYDQTQDAPSMTDVWRPEMEDALRRAAPAQTKSGQAGAAEPEGDGQEQRAGLAVPIILRGQPIGVLGIENPDGTQQWSADEVALLEEVGQQLALALENARLFDETQRRAERERLVTEITARIRASTDILGVLETTATELGRALNTSRAVVKLTVDDRASMHEPAGTL